MMTETRWFDRGIRGHFIRWAGVLGALGVTIGAFGAHGLPGMLERQNVDAASIDRRVDSFEVGVRYHISHVLALLGLAAVARRGRPAYWVAGWLWIAGIVVFAGGLYAYGATGASLFARIVPLGGLSFIAGWIFLAVASWNRPD